MVGPCQQTTDRAEAMKNDHGECGAFPHAEGRREATEAVRAWEEKRSEKDFESASEERRCVCECSESPRSVSSFESVIFHRRPNF